MYIYWWYNHIGVGSNVVCSTIIGNARASVRGIGNKTDSTLFYVMLNLFRIEQRACDMKCTICNTEIRGRYLIDTWHQPICAFHKVEYCSSCGRFVKPTDFHSGDGRCLCSFCQPSIVRTPQHIEWVEERVRDILSKQGITDLPTNLSIKLVSPVEMSHLNGTNQVSLFQPGLTRTSKTISMFTSHCTHVIYIFDNLPKIQFAGVLAHEMLHVWQNEKGITLSPIYTEGFCNMGSYVVYRAINTELSQHLIKQLEKDPNPIYGDGFRIVTDIYKNSNSLADTMNAICKK